MSIESVQRRLNACWHCMKRLKTAPHSNDDGYGRASPRLHTIFDISSVGLAISVPVGVYVISGQVVKDISGPSAILAILISGLAAGLSGMCYAELRSRNHRVHCGSYEYLYRLSGEAVAFITGWCLFLHHITSTAMIAKSISQNFDFMLDNRIKNMTISKLGDIPGIDSYLDFISFFIVLVTMVLVSASVRGQHRWLNLVLNCVSCVLLLFVLVVSIYHIDFGNWSTPGKFFPHGGSGVFAGAGVFAYAFCGYETMLKSADFTSRAIKKPLLWSTMITYGLLFLLLLGVTCSCSLLCPSISLVTDTPLPEAFTLAGLGWVRYMVDPAVMLILAPAVLHHFVQAVCQGFDLSDDGLVFRSLSMVSDGAETPLLAAVLPGIVGSILALVIPLTSLLQLSAFTLLLSQTVCSVAILQLRYRPSVVTSPEHKQKRGRYLRRKKQKKHGEVSTPTHSYSAGYGAAIGSGGGDHATNNNSDEQSYVQLNGIMSPSHERTADGEEGSSSDTDIDDVIEEYHDSIRVQAVRESSPHRHRQAHPTNTTLKWSSVTVAVFLTSTICSASILTQGSSYIASGHVFVTLLLVVFLLFTLISAVFLSRQPVDYIDSMFLVFQVPLLPWIPMASVFLNTHLILLFQPLVWLVVFMWITLGVLIYLGYGITHSSEAQFPDFLPEEQRVLLPFSPSAQTTTSTLVTGEGERLNGGARGGRVTPATGLSPAQGFVGQDGDLLPIDLD